MQVPGHHVEPHRADQRHVAAHDGVAALRHPRHVGAAHRGVESERCETEPERTRDLGDLAEVRLDFGPRVVQCGQQPARQLELPRRLQRHRRRAALQPNRSFVVEDRLPAAAGDAFEQGADAAWLVRWRQEIGLAEAEFLVLGADGETLAGLAPFGDESGELGRRRDRRRVGVSGVRHVGSVIPAGHDPVARRHGRRATSKALSRRHAPQAAPARRSQPSRPAGSAGQERPHEQRRARPARQAPHS